nr:unnamed protein product [Spirometra erinaceieuropaei]
MDDEGLFYGRWATKTKTLQGHPEELSQARSNKPEIWEGFALDRLVWKRAVMTGVFVYEDNLTAAAKAKRATRKSRAPPIHNSISSNMLSLPTHSPRADRPVGHLRTQCNNNPTTPPAACSSTSIFTPASAPTAFTPATTPTTRDPTPDDPPPSTTINTGFIIPAKTPEATITNSPTFL